MLKADCCALRLGTKTLLVFSFAIIITAAIYGPTILDSDGNLMRVVGDDGSHVASAKSAWQDGRIILYLFRPYGDHTLPILRMLYLVMYLLFGYSWVAYASAAMVLHSAQAAAMFYTVSVISDNLISALLAAMLVLLSPTYLAVFSTMFLAVWGHIWGIPTLLSIAFAIKYERERRNYLLLLLTATQLTALLSGTPGGIAIIAVLAVTLAISISQKKLGPDWRVLSTSFASILFWLCIIFINNNIPLSHEYLRPDYLRPIIQMSVLERTINMFAYGLFGSFTIVVADDGGRYFSLPVVHVPHLYRVAQVSSLIASLSYLAFAYFSKSEEKRKTYIVALAILFTAFAYCGIAVSSRRGIPFWWSGYTGTVTLLSILAFSIFMSNIPYGRRLLPVIFATCTWLAIANQIHARRVEIPALLKVRKIHGTRPIGAPLLKPFGENTILTVSSQHVD